MIKEDFWKKITPIWFQWLGWFMALGAIGFVSEKTQNTGLHIIYGITYICFFMFTTSKISELMSFEFISNKKLNKHLALMISILVLAFTLITLTTAITGLVGS